MSEDDPKKDEGTGPEDPPDPLEEHEESGLGLTEEFARLEEEIKREIGKDEPAEPEAPGPKEPESEQPEPEPTAADPAGEGPGETEEWSNAGPARPVDGEAGDAEPEVAESEGVEPEESEPGPEVVAEGDQTEDEAPAEADPPEEPEAPTENDPIEHTIVRLGPPPTPIGPGGYGTEPDEAPEVKTPGLWWRFLTASTLIIVSVATAVAVSSIVFLTDVAGDLQAIPGVKSKLDKVDPGDPQTILIVGSDKRSDTPGDPGRSDTTMLLRVDPEDEILSLFSLPRDLKVDIAGGSYGVGKLNEAFTIGGVKKTLETVQDLTGLEINHVVNVDFEGFAKAVDAIGCVYVDVDRHYFNDNSTAISSLDTYAEINVNAGYQRLCGQNALDYVRYRHTDTDIVRSARQQDFLRNARAQVPVGEVLPLIGGDKGSRLIDIFTEYTSSDIDDAAEVITALNAFIGVRDVPINQISFDGELGTSYVTATPEQIGEAVDEFLNGVDTEGPSGGDNALKRKGDDEKKKEKKAKDPTDDANVIPTSEALDPETGVNKFEAFGRTSARRLDFPVWIPTKVAVGSLYSDESRQYDIKDPDDKKEEAYKLVIQYQPTLDLLPEYYGFQGTTWSDPPILEKPSETRTIDGRDFDIYYDGDRIRMVAWHDEQDNSYWVSNTLIQTLDEAEMLAIAASMEQVKSG